MDKQTTPSPVDENLTKDTQTTADGITSPSVAEAMTTSDDPAALPDGKPTPKKKKGETEPDPTDPNEKKEKAKGMEAVRTSFFSELMPLTEAVIDAEKKTLEVTLIKPGWSANGKYYSSEMLGRDMHVFEGTKAYADHPSRSEETNRPERSVRDISGYYTGVHQSPTGSLKATRHFVGRVGDEMYPLAVEAVNNKPDLMGLSINALGKTKLGEAEGRKGIIVESLVKGNSVDDVTTPAAGGKYERLLMGGDEFTNDLLQNMDYEEWRESRPDFVARIKTEMRTARKEEGDATAIQEVATLHEQVTLLETTNKELAEAKTRADTDLTDLRASHAQRETELTADRKLTESKLPDTWKTELKPRLLGLTESEMDTLVAAEKTKYFAIKQPVPVRESGAGVITNAEPIKPELVKVAEALGVDSRTFVLEGESPEHWAARIAKFK